MRVPRKLARAAVILAGAAAVVTSGAAATTGWAATGQAATGQAAAAGQAAGQAATGRTATGWVRLAHLSPNAPPVDVYLYSFGNPHARLVLHHVSYGTVSPYQQVPAGDYT